ncbi:hypothetical protein G6514_003999 [Epicoccum nigrum]|nr:hypothetical protein G6514_003999 [Epicoccum nigrum]
MADTGDTVILDPAVELQVAGDISDLLQTKHCDAFTFTEPEDLALNLYDQLRELELQQSLVKAHNLSHVPEVSTLSDDDLEERLITAEREAMAAKAEYELRNKITHNVLVTDPILKAVHGDERSDLAEKYIVPQPESNTIAMIHGHLASKLASSTRVLVAMEQANIVANQKNRELSETMLALAEAVKSQSADDVDDQRLREQIKTVEKELKDSRRRMKTLKGILSAMVVGSGINWAADGSLVDLVMVEEDD